MMNKLGNGCGFNWIYWNMKGWTVNADLKMIEKYKLEYFSLNLNVRLWNEFCVRFCISI